MSASKIRPKFKTSYIGFEFWQKRVELTWQFSVCSFQPEIQLCSLKSQFLPLKPESHEFGTQKPLPERPLSQRPWMHEQANIQQGKTIRHWTIGRTIGVTKYQKIICYNCGILPRVQSLWLITFKIYSSGSSDTSHDSLL